MRARQEGDAEGCRGAIAAQPLKPDVVLFGEYLPVEAIARARGAGRRRRSDAVHRLLARGLSGRGAARDDAGRGRADRDPHPGADAARPARGGADGRRRGATSSRRCGRARAGRRPSRRRPPSRRLLGQRRRPGPERRLDPRERERDRSRAAGSGPLERRLRGAATPARSSRSSARRSASAARWGRRPAPRAPRRGRSGPGGRPRGRGARRGRAGPAGRAPRRRAPARAR